MIERILNRLSRSTKTKIVKWALNVELEGLDKIELPLKTRMSLRVRDALPARLEQEKR